MRVRRVFFGLLFAASIATGAHAADRYYLEPGSDAAGAVLYDMPVSLALARCYGRYDGVARAAETKNKALPGPDAIAHAKSQKSATADALVAAAKRDRGLTFKLETLRPGDDGPYGETLPPSDAPATLYLFYAQGADDVAAGAPDALMRACDVLLDHVKSRTGLGAARERVFTPSGEDGSAGEPVVLALANCSGMIDYLNAQWRGETFGDDAKAAADVAMFHDAVIAVAGRERKVTIALSDFEKKTLPAQIEDAWQSGFGGVDSDPPDFGNVVGEMYEVSTRPYCMKVLELAK